MADPRDIAGHVDERPWGRGILLEVGPGYKVKRLEVTPGHRLSLQKHRHRCENWVVAAGTATVTVGDRTFSLRLQEHTFIPVDTLHRLANGGPDLLVVIEVQHGAPLSEDDIIRVADDYRRVPPAAGA
ncbi:MAG TPA: phosphomannose isomerase type II C-terminal cupin domain [Candidatus Methylomirabilis sp.]|nr:phosphomannose isomerase type II C-terminal cupin domain [Candidatus Methylomirabilis sp.]